MEQQTMTQAEGEENPNAEGPHETEPLPKMMTLLSTMEQTSQQSINNKISKLTEKLNLLLEESLSGASMTFIMNEKINVIKLTQTHYQNLVFEQELFDLLLKNKFALSNTTATDKTIDENSMANFTDISYANNEYPFSLIICSREARRSSILVNNIGMVLIKFILYLRMLNKLVATIDTPVSFLATNLKIVPFGRLCIDVDYKPGVSYDADGDVILNREESHENYQKFIEKCFAIVCEYTTLGDVIMTQNCYTPNTRSFHLIAEQHFDAATCKILFFRIAEKIKETNPNIQIDQVQVWMLPYGRGHVPVRKYNRKTNEFVDLFYPYTEADFELCMPFDLCAGIDNLFTLLNYSSSTAKAGGVDFIDNAIEMTTHGLASEYTDELHEYHNDEIIQTYTLSGIDDIINNLQSFVHITTFNYDFSFQSQHRFRYHSNYMQRVLNHMHNSYFLIISNKRLILENTWQIPKTKPNKRPMEFYEIYRFLDDQYINGVTCTEDLFDQMPDTLVRKNVTIGDVNEHFPVIIQQPQDEELCKSVKRKGGSRQIKYQRDDDSHRRTNLNCLDNLMPATSTNPWPYLTHNDIELMPLATEHMKNTYKFFRFTIADNVYTFEKSKYAMSFFDNLQSIINYDSDDFVVSVNNICDSVYTNMTPMTQNFIFPMYEFFCRVHFIKACITQSEYDYLVAIHSTEDCLLLNLDDEFYTGYRKSYVQFTPEKRTYKSFPSANSPLANIWQGISTQNKILLHIFYMMIVEHNYTSLFIQLHNDIRDCNSATEVICSFLLNIITVNDNASYASKEFLNFIYCTFIDAGINIKYEIVDQNVVFNMTQLASVITDMQAMFITNPIWYFLANFQYVNEEMGFSTRIDLFIKIFQQRISDEYRNGGSGGGDEGENTAPQAKQQRAMNAAGVKVYSPAKQFKKYNIPMDFENKLMPILYRHILALCSTENGMYIYDGSRFVNPPVNFPSESKTVTDPVKYAHIYTHQYGIYNSWTMQYERRHCALYTQINISNESLEQYTDICNVYNDKIYRVLVNRFLKSITFARLLNYQRNLALFLAPIYNPNEKPDASQETINYCIDSIQINIHDLASSDFQMPDAMFYDLLQTKTKLYEFFKWLYIIMCHYSESFSCVITTPSSFIPKCMLPQIKKASNEGNFMDNDATTSQYTKFQQQVQDHQSSMENNQDTGEQLYLRFQKLLKYKQEKNTSENRHFVDEFNYLCENQLTCMLMFYETLCEMSKVPTDNANDTTESSSGDENNIMSPDDDTTATTIDPEASSMSYRNQTKIKKQKPLKELTKINLSNSNGGNSNDMDFMFNSEEFIDITKNKLLMDLFNRKLNFEIAQMSCENFQKIIEENFSQHITKFILLCLSWFIRTLHDNIFTDTFFFRELKSNRTQLYKDLCELLYRHNGYFIYNEKINMIADVFGHYCRHTKLVVDPVFQMSFELPADLYLDYDSAIEKTVPANIIKDIETGCVSGIYQGQFITDTIVDLSRLWARLTFPRNNHRVSPLFNGCTSTGKSEVLKEKCNSIYNNKYHSNYLDPTSLKSCDNRGVDMAPELHSNLVVCIEELTNLGPKFKEICGHSSITYKPLYNDVKNSYQNNATLVLATNNDPKCTEAAVIARLHVFPRHIQYVLVHNYMKFQREAICSAMTMLNTNNILAVQLITEKLPRTFGENYRGNYMMTWLLKRFFLFNITDPVTVQTSDTLQYNIDKFQNQINAPQLVLESLELNKGEMSLHDFRRLVYRICDENRTLFNSKVDAYNVFTIVSEKLKVVINIEKQTIRVTEKIKQ